MCDDKQKKYNKEYYLKNRDKIIKYSNKYGKENKESKKLYMKEYHLKNKERLIDYNQKNKEHIIAYRKEYFLKNKDKLRIYSKKWAIEHPKNRIDFVLKKKYGISFEEKELMIKNQNNKCKICGRTFPKEYRPSVDHCHLSNKVRGILCCKCNIALGNFNDSIEIMEKAIQYIKNSLLDN